MASSVSFALQKDGVSSLINNLASVQFIHRWFAFIVLSFMAYIYYLMKRKPVSQYQQGALNHCIYAVIIQILLGIFTLLASVPVWMGVAHQVGAFLLFASVIYLLFHFTPRVVPGSSS